MSYTGFWKLVGVLCGAVLLSWLVFGYSASGRAGTERDTTRRLADSADEFTRRGLPADEVEASLAVARERLDALEVELAAVTLDIPVELEPSPGRDMLYVQRRISTLRDGAAARGFQLAVASALGFRDDVTATAMPRVLRRLAVVERLVEAAADAGIQSITRGEPIEPASPAGQDLIGWRFTMDADEKSLISLVRNLTVPGSALAVRSLDVRVRDQTGGTFQVVMEVAGVLLLDASSREPEVEQARSGEAPLVPTLPPGVF